MSASLPARTLERPGFGDAFAATAFVRAMLAFESALAAAQAHAGLVPEASARAIAAACDRLAPDIGTLVAEGKRSATLAVPLVRLLREAVHAESPAAAPHVHLGATSQDVLDTAMVPCLRPCLDEADRVLEAAVRSLAARAREHRATPMLARTLMQPALPVSAGLVLAQWALALAQDRERLAESAAAGLAVQLGGAAGSLDAMGGHGAAIRAGVARTLGLADRPHWHVHRNAWLDLMGAIALAVASAGKIARDVALHMQPEVGEMRESAPREGVGASSAMPHKRNPVGCVHGAAAALRMPGLLATLHAAALAEQQRALGGWQAELAVVPEIASCLGTALDFLEPLGAELVIDAQRMRRNLESYGPPGHGAEVSRAETDERLAALAHYLS
jgi:3-carboxy-cis,cis-muconate cycloisomerase